MNLFLLGATVGLVAGRAIDPLMRRLGRWAGNRVADRILKRRGE